MPDDPALASPLPDPWTQALAAPHESLKISPEAYHAGTSIDTPSYRLVAAHVDPFEPGEPRALRWTAHFYIPGHRPQVESHLLTTAPNMSPAVEGAPARELPHHHAAARDLLAVAETDEDFFAVARLDVARALREIVAAEEDKKSPRPKATPGRSLKHLL